MVSENKESTSYVDNALIAFNEIMSRNKKNTVEDITRASKGELFVLRFLSKRNSQVLPSELSTALCATTGRISALLGNLEKKGLIERDIDKNNRRNILVTLTEAGRRHTETEISRIQRGMTQIFVDMGESDTTEFIRLSRKFFDLMQKNMPHREDNG